MAKLLFYCLFSQNLSSKFFELNNFSLGLINVYFEPFFRQETFQKMNTNTPLITPRQALQRLRRYCAQRALPQR